MRSQRYGLLPTFCGKGQGLFYVSLALIARVYIAILTQKPADTLRCLPVFSFSLFTLPFSLHCPGRCCLLASPYMWGSFESPTPVSPSLPTFCGQIPLFQKRCTQFVSITSMVVANFFARAGLLQENCSFAEQKGSSANFQAISRGMRRQPSHAHDHFSPLGPITARFPIERTLYGVLFFHLRDSSFRLFAKSSRYFLSLPRAPFFANLLDSFIEQ